MDQLEDVEEEGEVKKEAVDRAVSVETTGPAIDIKDEDEEVKPKQGTSWLFLCYRTLTFQV